MPDAEDEYQLALERLVLEYDSHHLDRFRASVGRVPNEDAIGGKTARSFATPFPGAAWQCLPDRRLGRSEVVELCRDASTQIETLCAAIFAWGGMRVENRNRLVRDPAWLQVAIGIRAGDLSRAAAFDAFRTLRRKKQLSGLGPAFFTKLIYFLTPRGSAPPYAYIMDQWASRTANLLAGRDVALLDVTTASRWEADETLGQPTTTYAVSDQNTAAHYEDFCRQMDGLVVACGTGPDIVDRAAMGEGDENWRPYLEEHLLVPAANAT